MKYFLMGLAIFVVGGFVYARVDLWIRRRRVTKAFRKFAGSLDKVTEEAKRKGLLP